MLGIPQHALAARETPGAPDWWERSTPAYLAGYMAYEVLHIPVLEYLTLPRAERDFARAYLVAKQLKQDHGKRTSDIMAKHLQFMQQMHTPSGSG